MEEHGWQISGAAQHLGISRPSLYKLIEAQPAIRPAAMIPADEIGAALDAHAGDVDMCASRLKTPSEALRRLLRVGWTLRSEKPLNYTFGHGTFR